MFKKFISLLIVMIFLLIGTAAFTVAAEQQQAPAQQTPITTKPALVALPDLVVVAATLVPPPFTIKIDVRNVGGSMAGPFEVKVVYEQTLFDGSKKLGAVLSYENGLGPGSTKTIIQGLPVPASTSNIPKIKEVFVDSGNSVKESSEGNNKVTY